MNTYDNVSIDTVVEQIDMHNLFSVRGTIDGNYFSYTEKYGADGEPEAANLILRTSDFQMEAVEEAEEGTVREGEDIYSVNEKDLAYDIDENILSAAQLDMEDETCVYQHPDTFEDGTNRWIEHEAVMYGKANAIYRKAKQLIAEELWFKRREDALDEFL